MQLRVESEGFESRMSRRAKTSIGASTLSESQKYTASLTDKPCKTEGKYAQNMNFVIWNNGD
jgi:hypothetical protein